MIEIEYIGREPLASLPHSSLTASLLKKTISHVLLAFVTVKKVQNQEPLPSSHLGLKRKN